MTEVDVEVVETEHEGGVDEALDRRCSGEALTDSSGMRAYKVRVLRMSHQVYKLKL
jgi:hypothetical protein